MSITFRFAPRGVAARIFCGVALLLLFALSSALQARAQAARVAPAPTPEKARPKGSITGRVVGEDGQPFAGARVYAKSSGARGSALTKPDGTFKIENLARAPYRVDAYAPGFFDASYLEYERGARAFQRLGDHITLTLARGGVVTGRVVDAKGEPAIGVRVNMVRVRTLEGRPARELSYLTRSLERMTDDRGVYRIYGLLPGVYVVSAGGRMSYGFGGIPHSEETPTFYPSTTRDASAELTMHTGEELADVDIRLRGDRGHAVSGTVAGVSDAAHTQQATTVSLISASTTEYHGQAYFYGRATSEGFAFDGLTDGEYDLVAERYVQEGWQTIATASRRVQVKGADVTGLRLTLQPVGSISGRFVFEKPAAAAEAKPAATGSKPLSDESKASCAGSAEMLYSDAAVIARREGGARAANEPSTLETSPDEKGEFALRGLGAGAYRLELQLGKGYFVTSVRAAVVATSKPAPTSKTVAPTVSTSGAIVRLQQGEDASGVVVTAAYGAASLKGQLGYASCDCPNDPVRAYLVPQESERGEDPLRYAEATLVRVGPSAFAFAFDGLAPGRYRFVVLPGTPQKQQEQTPLFLDAQGRAQLRRASESSGTGDITLAPCQRVDGDVRFIAPTGKGGTGERSDH